MMTQNTLRSLIVQLLVVVASATIATTAANADHLPEFRFTTLLATTNHNLPDSQAGDIYREGFAFLEQKNYVRARQKFYEGMRANNPGSMGQLGWLYYNGQGVQRDIGHAHRIWERGARRGDPLSSFWLGYDKLFGDGIETDIEAAIKLLSVGLGKDVVQNHPELLSKALGDYDAAAQNTTILEEQRKHITHVVELATFLLDVPAYQANARSALLVYYGSENSPLKNYAAALELAQPAAEAGDAEAAYYMGLLHFDGYLPDSSPEMVRKWFARAAEGGFVRGYQLHASLLLMGHGGPRDVTGACDYAALALQSGQRLFSRLASACNLPQEARE